MSGTDRQEYTGKRTGAGLEDLAEGEQLAQTAAHGRREGRKGLQAPHLRQQRADVLLVMRERES
jgi:hypothetical protein